MDHKNGRDRLNHLSQEKNLPSEASQKGLLQSQQQKKKKKIYVLPVIIVMVLFVSCIVFFFSLMDESTNIATNMEGAQLDPQSIVHYSLEVNGKEVPKDGKVAAAINGEKLIIGILQQQPTDHSAYSEEELTNAYLSGNVADHFVAVDEAIWEEYRKDEGKTSVFGYQTKNIQQGELFTITISDELKNRLHLTTNLITISTYIEGSKLPEDIVVAGQNEVALKDELEQEIRSLYALNDGGANLVRSINIIDSVAVIDFTDEFVKVVKPTLSNETKRELKMTIQKVMFISGDVDSIHFGINGDYNAWWSLME